MYFIITAANLKAASSIERNQYGLFITIEKRENTQKKDLFTFTLEHVANIQFIR